MFLALVLVMLEIQSVRNSEKYTVCLRVSSNVIVRHTRRVAGFCI
jgi:hypothetical protein